MKRTKEFSTNKGITLIALVITIIVMLILVGVTISMAVNGGLFEYAGKAVSETNSALKQEQQLINDIIDEYIKPNLPSSVETISKTESYVGCYADVDADGTVDGVIYADLAKSGSGNWNGYSYSYEAVAAEDLKDYYVSGTYDGDFNVEGTPKDVLTATGEGEDRFYVMALEDISTSTYTWYESKWEDGITVQTSGDFGTGKANTQAMIATWKADTDEAKSSGDVWGNIQTQVSNGWFVPSIAEWDAFTDLYDVDSSNYGDYGLSDYYWSSSQSDTVSAWYVDFRVDDVVIDIVYGGRCVRLCATF